MLLSREETGGYHQSHNFQTAQKFSIEHMIAWLNLLPLYSVGVEKWRKEVIIHVIHMQPPP